MIDVALYGGAALLLVSNFREATFDVDAVAGDENQRDLERYRGDRRRTTRLARRTG